VNETLPLIIAQRLYILLWLLLPILCSAQSKPIFLKSVAVQAQCYTTDNAGNIYAATAKNIVYRYNRDGDSSGIYSSKRRGAITQIDASNPLNVLLFHKDIPMITALNSMMNEKYSIDLRKFNLFMCPAVAYSADGDIWTYNTFENMIQKVNTYGADQNNSTPKLRQGESFGFTQLFEQQVQPRFITEQERQVFVVDSSQGIIRFDQFGNYVNTYHFNCDRMQYVQGNIVYFQQQTLHSYNTTTFAEAAIAVPSSDEIIIDMRIAPQRLYVLYANHLDIYSTE
jgi:hypothetical protein